MAYEPSVALHPAVAMVLLGSIALISMCALHPVFAAISLVGAILCSYMVRGGAATLSGLRWQLPAIALISLLNPLFSASGSTVVLQLGPMAVYAESLAFGAVAAAIMVASLTWLECLAHIVPASYLRSTLGKSFPTVALALSMTSRLVPLLLRRYATIGEAQALNTASRSAPPKSPVVMATTRSGVLLSWALEDSLVRSDAMRARGWGMAAKRTSYQSHELHGLDIGALVGVCVCAFACAVLAWVACSQWHFYPTMPSLVVWWGYLPFGVFCAAPSLVVIKERFSWWRIQRR